ncbi:hypothetical protein L6164_010065 [Bauhinia variegata]|uniref:Uncharacterized protein n=1 Tax=Bauhinia variegata TaxID=167791 RepID=A0ACB9PLY7_BAUVA|nr:hypothetical protein L6164_010065 [Bauhinia variegata]
MSDDDEGGGCRERRNEESDKLRVSSKAETERKGLKWDKIPLGLQARATNQGRRCVALTSVFHNMKRTMPWSDDDDSSEDGSSSSHSDSEHDNNTSKKKSKVKQGKSNKQKSGVIDFEALRRHGYKGGPSVLNVPPPKDPDGGKQDWTWSTGKERREKGETEESYEERMKTRAAISLGEQLPTALTQKDKKNLSFSQKEKRKRELGQASRGKNYVEEEKRLLRDSGIYSGFDT